MPMLQNRRSRLSLTLTCVGGAVAMSGWVMFGLESRDAAIAEGALRSEIAALRDSRDRHAEAAEQNRINLVEAAQLREQIASAQAEIARLAQSLTQAQAELASARAVLSPVPDPWTAAERGLTPAASASAGGMSVQAAQEGLTRLGYGPLSADGILGPSTRGAIERFQREQGLAVNGDLDVETWQRLRTAAGLAAAE